ncbi:MAG: flagellar motor protein MotB [Myxococcales bacterium]|nr:flagellar motor protein MotB [Myxococcales bacterium]
MRTPILSTALLLALGGGVAIADPAQPPETSQETQSTQSTQASAATTNIQPVDMFFDTNSAQLSNSASADLQRVATWSRCNPQAAVILEGYADPRGSKAHNVKLSGERAAVVREKLIALGVPSSRIVVTVYGENGPKRANLAEERRVTAKTVTHPVGPEDLSG